MDYRRFHNIATVAFGKRACVSFVSLVCFTWTLKQHICKKKVGFNQDLIHYDTLFECSPFFIAMNSFLLHIVCGICDGWRIGVMSVAKISCGLMYKKLLLVCIWFYSMQKKNLPNILIRFINLTAKMFDKTWRRMNDEVFFEWLETNIWYYLNWPTFPN